MKRVFCLTLLAAVLAVQVSGLAYAEGPARPAQQTNLVANPSFESVSGGNPASWTPWWITIAKTDQNLSNFTYAYQPNFNAELISNGASPQLVRSGNASARVINSWDPWQAGWRQAVTAPAGTRVRVTAYGYMWASNEMWPTADANTLGFMRVGVDPNGTDYPTASSQVTWSGSIRPAGSWQAVSVEATVGANGRLMVILSGGYTDSRLFMAQFWDDVTVEVIGAGQPQPQPTTPSTGGGGAQPQPTTPPRPVATRVPFVMPTPDANGNLIYVVQSGDTLWGISAQTGKTLDELRTLNGGLPGDIISIGQRLVIGQATPPTQPPPPTSEPTATLAPSGDGSNPPPTANPGDPNALPTPTSIPTGQLCVQVYNDQNGSGTRDDTETAIGGAQYTVVDANGLPVQTHNVPADQVDYHCFDLPLGLYTLSVAPPAGYNPTTNPNFQLEVTANRAQVQFGAQPSGTTPAEPGTGGSTPGTTDNADDSGNLRVALFGAAGVMLLLAAAGVAGFLMLRRR